MKNEAQTKCGFGANTTLYICSEHNGDHIRAIRCEAYLQSTRRLHEASLESPGVRIHSSRWPSAATWCFSPVYLSPLA
jgi:hypothetical protein